MGEGEAGEEECAGCHISKRRCPGEREKGEEGKEVEKKKGSRKGRREREGRKKTEGKQRKKRTSYLPE